MTKTRPAANEPMQLPVANAEPQRRPCECGGACSRKSGPCDHGHDHDHEGHDTVAGSPLNAPRPKEQVLTTMDAEGRRQWIWPRVSKGPWLTRRTIVAWVLLVLFVAVPFMRIAGKPVILLDVAHRQFTLFGYTFLPTDTLLLVIFMLGVFVTVFLVTALAGRVWCGWACPQTVYLEFVYRPLERIFHGTTGKGGKPAAPVTPLRRAGYLAAALVVSIIPANAFLSYFVGSDQLLHWMAGSPWQHPLAFLLMAATTGLMLFNFGYFREQLCILACPYARFQSVLLDRHSLIVSYDDRRGEPRGKMRRATVPPAQLGDCVDCHMCVTTCPTGIDIRNGLQLECIGCTQCIDACDAVMARLNRPPGLIRYGSQAGIERKPTRVLRPRVMVYAAILGALLTAGAVFVAVKPTADVTLMRNFGSPFMQDNEGRISNSLRLKLVNRSDTAARYKLEVLGADGATVIAPENPLTVMPGESRTEAILIKLPQAAFSNGACNVTLHVHDESGFSRDVPARLLGPAAGGNP